MNHLVTLAASSRSYAAHDSARAAGQFTVSLAVLLHHAVTLNIRGNSYRLKEKLKAGLIRSTSDDNSQPGGEI